MKGLVTATSKAGADPKSKLRVHGRGKKLLNLTDKNEVVNCQTGSAYML